MTTHRAPPTPADVYLDQVAASLLQQQRETVNAIAGMVRKLAPSSKLAAFRAQGGTAMGIMVEVGATRKILVTVGFADAVKEGISSVRVIETWNPETSQVLQALVEAEPAVDLARQCYEAYRDHRVEHDRTHTDAQLPAWADLDEHRRARFRAVAEAASR